VAIAELISGDQTRRVNYLRSYELAPTHADATGLFPLGGWLPTGSVFDGTRSSLYLRTGSVSVNGGPAVVWPGAYIGMTSRGPMGVSTSFQANAVHQLYVDGTSGAVSLQVVASTSSAFPAGSLPLYVLVTDSVFRFSAVTDKRPSSAGMQATLESVSDTTTRGSYASNFAFDQVQGAQNQYGVTIGPGQIGGKIFYGTGGVTGNNGGLLYSEFLNFALLIAGNSQTVQAFINTSGQLSFLTAIDIAGNVIAGGITHFPAGSLPLFIAVFDAVGRISSLSDYRPA
jgi:hypothetical protein